MYINKVIEAADRLYPNEYTLDEKYEWCDELSAMLVNEYRKEYDKVTLQADDNGDYLLPEGISFEMIDRIFDGSSMLEKQDFRSEGVTYLSGINRRIAIKNPIKAKNDIDVIYLRQHEPIRNIEIEKEIDFISGGFTVCDTKFNGFRKGDVVSIKVISTGQVYSDIPIFEVMDASQISNGVKYIGKCYNTEKDTFEGDVLKGSHLCQISRTVTEKTVCDAPYDSMYIEYILSKICYYQHDYDTYNQHTNLFNSKLAAYQMWLKERDPMADDGKMKNWW